MSVLAAQPGCRVALGGRRYRIAGLEGALVRLQGLDGAPDGVADLGAMVCDPSIGLLDAPPEGPGELLDDAWQMAAPEERERTEELLCHLREMKTGYRSGTASEPAPGEPRAEYDPACTSAGQRVETKSGELASLGLARWSPSRLRDLHTEAVVKGRVSVLLDRRKTNSGRRPEQLDPRALETLLSLLAERADRADTQLKWFRRELRVRLDQSYGEGTVPLPASRTVLERHLKVHGRPLGFFGGHHAKRRQSMKLRPDTPYQRMRPGRAGQFVLIDGTRLDCFALDPLSGQWVRLELVIALDLYTRAIVGWRFTPVGTRRVDAALLLRDIVVPKTIGANWPAEAAWRYHGIPRNIVLGLTKEWGLDDEPAGVPIACPDHVVVDNAWAYKSVAFMAACGLLDISVMSARPIHPTDKAHVESAFDFINSDFVASLPGYKGPDVLHRGADAEGEAFFSVDEIERYFAQWVAVNYHRRGHDGCRHCLSPKLKLSPNERFEMSVAAGGFPYVAPRATLYYELLPCEGKEIQSYGVDHAGLRYDGRGLEGYRGRPSGLGGAFGDKWPIFYDPRDLSRVYFRDAYGEWHTLFWHGNPDGSVPFHENELTYFKRIVIQQFAGRRLTNQELEAAYLRWLLSVRQAMAATGEERQLFARALVAQAGLVGDGGPAPEPARVDPTLLSFVDAGGDVDDYEWDEDDPDDYGVLG